MSLFKNKKKKEKESIQDKNFIKFARLYPECNVIELKDKVFLKLLQVKDNLREGDSDTYNQSLKELLKIGQQFSYKGNMMYVVIKAEADYIDDAVVEFESMMYECAEMADVFETQEVKLKDWIDMINRMSQFKDFDEEVWEKLCEGRNKKNKQTIKGMIQPYDRVGHAEYLEIGNKVSKTIMLTNYPSKVFNGLITEIMEISDSITGSLYLKEVEMENCLAALDMEKEKKEDGSRNSYIREYLTKNIEKNEKLFHSCLFLNISGFVGEVDRAYKKIEELCKKYLIGINTLEHQQNKAFLSVLPLGNNLIHYNKVLHEDNVIGLLNYSWIKRLHTGIYYGKSNISEKDVMWNRLLEKSSGFYLGSDSRTVRGKIKNEIMEIQRKFKDRRIAVFTLGAVDRKSNVFIDLNKGKMLCKDVEINREILRGLFYLVIGTNGNITSKNKDILSRVLENENNLESYEKFISAVSNYDVKLAEKLNTEQLKEIMSDKNEVKKQRGKYCVYKALCETHREQLLYLFGGIANCDANIIYILDGDEFAKLGDNRFINRILEQTDKMITVMGNDGMVMYRNPHFKKAIRESEFINVSRCNTLEKINLASILKLSKEQSNFISENVIDEQSIIITQYAEYLLKSKIETEEEVVAAVES